MNCKYIFKGKSFSSELALDEYLLNFEELYKQFGDAVYQMTLPQRSVRGSILNLDAKVRALRQKGDVVIETTENEFMDSNVTVKLPRIGVSEFLKAFMDAQGDPLFKKFNSEDYWTEKRRQWQSMEYWNGTMPGEEVPTQEEVDLVFQGGEVKPIEYQSDFDAIRKRIEEMWAQQSYLGTATHAAMAAYWKYIHINKLENPVSDIAALEKFIREELKRDVSSEVKVSCNDFLQDEHVTQLANHAINIHKKLIDEFSVKDKSNGKKIKPVFLSEVGLTTQVEFQGNQTDLVGIADLIVIDAEGNIQIIDYKTSPKPYVKYNEYKKITFYHQLATYRRMLERHLNLSDKSSNYVIPLQFKGFDYDGNKMTFSEITTTTDYLEELPVFIGKEAENIRRNLNKLLPITKVVDATTEELLGRNQEFMKDCFTSYTDSKILTDEKIIEKIKKQHKGIIRKDTKTRKYKYTFGTETILADSEPELIDKIREKYQEIEDLKSTRTSGLKHILHKSQVTGRNHLGDMGQMKRMRKNGREGSLEAKLSRYISHGWEVMDLPVNVEALGLIFLQNIHTHQIDVIKVSEVTWQELNDSVLLGEATAGRARNKTLTGTFESDIKQKQRPKSLVLDSCYGNIELMQAMNVIDMLPRLFMNNHGFLGEITVVDLKKDASLTASNSELLYNYNELCKLRSKFKKEDKVDNNFESENVKVLSKLELMKSHFREIMTKEKSDSEQLKRDWDQLAQVTSIFDNFSGNHAQLRQELINFVKEIEETFKLSPEKIQDYSEKEAPQYRLYYNALMAIADLDKINLRQQTEDHDSYIQRGILGIAGSMLDNPGNMQSTTLNYMAEQVNIAYQNVRDDVTKLNQVLRQKLNALKKDKEYTWLYTRTVGNQTDLYQNMFDKESDDFLFVNPWDSQVDLMDSEREFLQFVILTINGDRYKTKDADDLLARMEKEGAIKFLQVPLTKGSTASRISTDGLMETMKAKLTALLPSNIQETIKQNVEGFLSNSEGNEQYNKAQNGKLWEMTNYFEAGKNMAVRQSWFSDPDKGISFFEHNLETLTLKHAFAYSMKHNMDNVFPIIKAARIHLSMQGVVANDNFEKDIKYLTDFVKAKIFNMSLHPDHLKTPMYIIGEMMQLTSKLALAFNPRQLYQLLDGIWKDVAIVWRNKHDGSTPFTKKNMLDSFFWIFNDLRHVGDEKSLGELINDQYGINDMDMNSYVEKIHSDNVGLFNFWNVGFRFASRPDYYNRMTLFGAQMRGDGCFEAHRVENGKLVYDWTLDKRFEIYAKNWNNPTMFNDPEFKKQKALYIATARQFMVEHAKNDDGTDFELDLNNPQALPKAYTIQQSESMKSLSDLTYGYYSHEKKSLIQSTSIGAMFFQMNTFWSSKKNQYLAPGGVRMQGEMKHYHEDGKPVFYKLDENGEPTDELTFEDTGIPAMQWSGQFQEGILVTLWQMAQDLYYGDGNFLKRWGDMWDKYYNNEDENLRKAYRNNLRHFTTDMLGFCLLGQLVAPSLLKATEDYTKDVGNDEFSTAFINNCLLNTAHMFSKSTDDFAWGSAIFGKGLNWTPYSISSMSRLLQNISRMLSGDRDLYDGLINIFAASRGQEPILDFIKISTLGRSIGDNGKED